MKSNDGLNFYADFSTKGVFVSDAVIQNGLMIRDIFESPVYSESGGWDKTYKPDGWRGTGWHKAEVELRGWIGRTYKEFSTAINGGEPLHELFLLED